MMKRIYYTASAAIIVATTMFVEHPKGLSFGQPAVVSAVAPAYPVLALASNTSGKVELEVEINAAGEVTSEQIIDGHLLLRQATERTARRWRFAPDAGALKARTVVLTFVFRIMPKDTGAEELTPVFIPPYQVEVRHQPFEPVVDSDPPTYTRPSRRKKTKQATGASFKSPGE
jgi:TonB family protein